MVNRTSASMKWSLLLLFAMTAGLGCNEGGRAAERSLEISPKYALKDCLVRVDFAWGPGIAILEREDVVMEIISAMREATVVTRKIPLFLGHTANDRSYFVFYFVDECENRAALAKRFIDEFVVPKSKKFPEFSIVSEGIEPGFDGVLPSGAWISDDD